MEEKEWDKIAKHYHSEIVSPFYKQKNNKIIAEIKNIKNKKEKTAAEFGCGFFYLGKSLKHFKKIHASDFSKEMLKIARQKNKFIKNITFKKEDIRKIKYKNKFDIIISINSILMPSIKDIKRSFSNIYRSLKNKGKLILILPSIESALYHNFLLLNKELKNKTEKKAIESAKTKAENKKYDYFLGIYSEEKERQKFYYRHEIRYILKKTGFKKRNIKKFKYPWGNDISDFQDFPKEDKLWDWFITAEK